MKWRTCGKQYLFTYIKVSLSVVCEGDCGRMWKRIKDEYLFVTYIKWKVTYLWKTEYLFTYIKGWACLSCVKLTYLWKTEYLFTYIKDEPVCRVWRWRTCGKQSTYSHILKDEPVCRVWSWRTCGKQSTYSHILRMSLFVVCEGDVPVENRVLIHIY